MQAQISTLYDAGCEVSPMSALGQKQTSATQKVMSAVTPNSGHLQCTSPCPLSAPIADISHSFDHLVRTRLHCRRDREAEGFGGL